MSKFKVEFTLKQHTPIIHFQSEQAGATLRATELKPKFDRFLNEFVFNGEIPEEFLISKQKNALDYKVKVLPKESKSETIEQTNPRNGKSIPDPLFFGNMGDGDKKKFVFNNSVTIILSSFNSKLLILLEEKFEAFLANTNFGTRQSKGFGSFYISNKKFDKSLIPYRVLSFKSNDWKKDIGLFYQFLRQGINLPRKNNPFYTKPAIFSYAKSKNWTWDKKAIKEAYFNNKLQTQIEDHPNSDVLSYSSNQKYLLRDLFGLSSSQDWRSYRTKIEKENNDIERFKSPITFKVVDSVIYFWANNSIDDILNKEFKITAGRGNNNLRLSTPQEFDFDDFFDFVIKIDLSKHIDSKFHNRSEYKTLEKIYNSLKASI